MKTIVTFGEIMGRLSPPQFYRFRQSMPGQLDITFAGAEANVAVSLAHLGCQSRFITALPQNVIADACIGTLNGYGVDTQKIRRMDTGRLGLYFVERGANQRPSRVIYDRSYSSLSIASPSLFDWDSCLADAGWFHFTGITPALSQNAANNCLHALKVAKRNNIIVSCDLNFRSKLWQWDEAASANKLASRVMSELLPYVDVLIANESDTADVLGIQAGDTDVDSGILDLPKYQDVASKVVKLFPNIKHVAITLRESISASHNNWGALLYSAKEEYVVYAPTNSNGDYLPYEIKQIVDRVGAGDSFAAALIFALYSPEYSTLQESLAFATAASCLAHSIEGDFNLNTRSEIESLMKGSSSGRVVR